MRTFEAWIVTDGRAGNEAQALGLAEATARLLPLALVVKRIGVGALWRSLPHVLWGDPFARLRPEGALLRPPYPDLWFACGRISAPFTLAVKERHPAIFTVQAQRPRVSTGKIDLLTPPHHDRAQGANVFAITGSPHRATPERLAAEAVLLAPAMERLPRPRVAVLLGGDNRAYAPSEKWRADFSGKLRALADSGAGLMITPSRRTDAETIAAIKKALAGKPHFLWDGSPVGGLDNPYFGLLGLADHVIVTGDSVNMMTEAAATGKPVHIASVSVKRGADRRKFEAFHAALREKGVARAFTGALDSWTYAPLDETARAAEEIVRRFRAARSIPS
ncbi:MAG: mitochondrial fission ELM1 family protein [Amphiplicatus sp.]